MVTSCILSLLLGISSSYGSRFRFGGRIEQSQIKTHAPVRTVTRTVSIIFATDLDADRLLANLQNLADLEISGTVHFASPEVLFQFAVDSVEMVKVVCVFVV